MTAVYVLRHPQTTWNREERYQGRLESPLSAEGQSQARLAARAFAAGGLAAVYTSPLRRALALAREVAQAADSPLVVDHRLTEIGQTLWEGLPVGLIEQRYPDLYQLWRTRPDLVRFPEGESVHDVRVRAMSALEEIYVAYPGCHVAVVTHSVVVQVLAACALEVDLRYLHRVPAANAAITTLCGSHAPGRLLSLNVCDHLFHSPVASATAHDCVS